MRKLLICSAIASCFMYSNFVSAQTYTSIHTLGKPAIVQAKGMVLDLSDLIKSDSHLAFAVKDPKSGVISYTRNSKFVERNDGYYYQDEKRLQGYPVPTDILSPDCKLEDVKSPSEELPPVATTTVEYTHGNLNASDPVIILPFDRHNQATYDFTTTSMIYDSLGISHNLSVYYIKKAANTWTTTIYVDESAIGSGELIFNASGRLLSQSGMSALTFTPTSGAVSPQQISLSYPGYTQFGMPDNTMAAESDGMPTGLFEAYQIESNGYFSFEYTNGKSVTFTKIAVFKV